MEYRKDSLPGRHPTAKTPSTMTEKTGCETYRAGSTKQGAKAVRGTKLDRVMTRSTAEGGHGALGDPTT